MPPSSYRMNSATQRFEGRSATSCALAMRSRTISRNACAAATSSPALSATSPRNFHCPSDASRTIGADCLRASWGISRRRQQLKRITLSTPLSGTLMSTASSLISFGAFGKMIEWSSMAIAAAAKSMSSSSLSNKSAAQGAVNRSSVQLQTPCRTGMRDEIGEIVAQAGAKCICPVKFPGPVLI
jgi:hypothetical protein